MLLMPGIDQGDTEIPMSGVRTSEPEATKAPEPARNAGPRPRLAFLPFVIFCGLAFLFLLRLFAGDASRLPSALIGKQAPTFDLPGLEPGKPGLSNADLRRGHVSVLNVFASWCGPCHEENPLLLSLAQDKTLAGEGVQLIGFAYKDAPDDTRRYLGAEGNPYSRIGVDQAGRAGIDFGVYGVPETFIIKGDGTIAFKFVGPIDMAILNGTILPQIEKARH
jgi:cytochrome c biogenesis protein CcmG/thiol:disulfide interchange protein DsbE